MKPLFHRLAILSGFCTLSAADEAGVQSGRFLDLQDGDRVVFLGDSITHQCLYTQYIENFFYTRYPDRRIDFHNAGVSGDRAADALARFEDDVAAFQPDVVTVLLGMNDGEYAPFQDEVFTAYRTGMNTLIQRAEGLEAEVVALSPTMFDHHQLALRMEDPEFRFRDRSFDENYNSLMAFYGAWVREEAGADGRPFVNLWGPLNDLTFASRRAHPDFSLVEDAIHPGAAGHFVMAFSILSAAQPERRGVSSILITKRGDKWVAGKNSGVSDLVVSEAADEVSFTFLASALPWVAPDESSTYDLKWGESTPARVGYELTNAGHKLGAERLRVPGLAAGEYELSIDGESVATFSHLALAGKVELQKFAETPQSRQSLEVALLNRQRNDEAVRPMRDVWARIKRLRKEPKGEEAFTAEYDKLKAESDALQAKADEYEARIYEMAQPKPRRYLLTRVESKKK